MKTPPGKRERIYLRKARAHEAGEFTPRQAQPKQACAAGKRGALAYVRCGAGSSGSALDRCVPAARSGAGLNGV